MNSRAALLAFWVPAVLIGDPHVASAVDLDPAVAVCVYDYLATLPVSPSDKAIEAARKKDGLPILRADQAHIPGTVMLDPERIARMNASAENNLYTSTAGFAKRQTENSSEFGLSFESRTGTTSVATFGDPSRVQRMQLVVINGPDPSGPGAGAVTYPMRYDGTSRWRASFPGSIEGKWYYFKVDSQPGQVDSDGHSIPADYSIPDVTAPKISQYGTSQAYFYPDPALRPPHPVIPGPHILQEVDLFSMTPADVPKTDWGTPRAIMNSPSAQGLFEGVDGIELMPIRNSALVQRLGQAPSPLVYAHYWGYMPRDESISPQKGGPEDLVSFVDWSHTRGKLVVEDDIFQHTAAQGTEAYKWQLTNGYARQDITGTGNTINTTPGGVPARLANDRMRRDIGVIKLDGARADLFGAVDRTTAQSLSDTVHSMGGRVSGEPYAYPYDQSRWTESNNPVRNSGLWDHQFLRRAREMSRSGGNRDELLANVAGIKPDLSPAGTWFNSFKDRTAVVETHDGETLASYMNGDLRRVALTSGLQFSSQGDLLIGPGQPVAYRSPYLDNAGVELFKLSPEQERFKTFFQSLIKVRQEYRGYFGFSDSAQLRGKAEVISANNENDGSFSNQATGLLLKGPAPGLESGAHGPLLMLMNFSDRPVRFNIPRTAPGEPGWNTLVDTNKIAADPSGRMYPPARDGTYVVPPFSIAWLARPGP